LNEILESRAHRTIQRPVEISGVGIHSGRACRVLLQPSDRPGLVLVRDGAGITADLDAVSDTGRRTVLGGVSTVEHLMAAAFALGVTALQVEVEGDEIPITDGSAKPFVDALLGAGIHEIGGTVPEICLASPVWVASGDALAVALPAAALRVTYVVALRDGTRQAWDGEMVVETFARELAPARTWGYASDAAALWAAGLAAGADERNTLILEDAGYRNPPRFPDEPVRHKIVDLIGDLALLGARLRAHVVCVRGGHATHLALARAIRKAVGHSMS
jgi:UDP-3-O-[3-hydroxymyristoyl] N-acetylglucosamine deacetylase